MMLIRATVKQMGMKLEGIPTICEAGVIAKARKGVSKWHDNCATKSREY